MLGKHNLKPGESTELVIHYKTYKYPGAFNKSVSVFTSSNGGLEGSLQGEEETVIRLVGNVDPMPMGVIKMEPRKTEVGELIANDTNEVQIVLENEGDAPLTITRIVSTKFDTEYFVAGEDGGIEIAPGQNHTMKLVIKPENPGKFLDTILIYSDARNDIGKGYKGLLSGEAK